MSLKYFTLCVSQVATKTLPFYNEYFNVPYPLPKIDLIAIADFAAGELLWFLFFILLSFIMFLLKMFSPSCSSLLRSDSLSLWNLGGAIESHMDVLLHFLFYFFNSLPYSTLQLVVEILGAFLCVCFGKWSILLDVESTFCLLLLVQVPWRTGALLRTGKLQLL